MSRLETGHFRFTGLDIIRENDRMINVSMEEYAATIKEISNFRKE